MNKILYDNPTKSVAYRINLAFLPARASEQGNVIGLVSVYIYIYVIKKNCNRAN